MRQPILSIVAILVAAAPLPAQIRVHPTGVNVNAQGGTTVFLSYGGLAGYRPVDAAWCGELMPAAPAIGLQCDSATVFGHPPLRYDQSTASGTNGFTDVMSIPASVSRRAYQAAEAGAASAFYYVRRFRAIEGGPDQYVAVTCRLAGGGARTPLSLTDVRLRFESDEAIVQLEAGTLAPRLAAEVVYTGTGRLAGRWEIVLPGDEVPTAEDLLTEATLPLERRGTQRRYTQLSRFNLFLPPTGRIAIPGPDPERLPVSIDGMYLVLLRVEATSDKEGDSDLGAVGAGSGVVAGGAVAGFPMPVLRYFVGSGQTLVAAGSPSRAIPQLVPAADGVLGDGPIEFRWTAIERGARYRVEIETEEGRAALSALVPGTVTRYQAPPWLREKVPSGRLRWRVVGLNGQGAPVGRSGWRWASWPPPAGDASLR